MTLCCGKPFIDVDSEKDAWNRESHPLVAQSFGCWEIFLPHGDNGATPAIAHDSKVKLAIVTKQGERIERISPWAVRVVQDRSIGPLYEGTKKKQFFLKKKIKNKNNKKIAVYWNPPQKYTFHHPRPVISDKTGLKIYEAHVGICTPEGKIASYDEFRERVLPCVAKQGYNAIQLMAIMEHAYYASFGYQVSSFFAVSSRFGTPEQLKQLVDEAHALGIAVFLDVVHSHASKNGIRSFFERKKK